MSKEVREMVNSDGSIRISAKELGALTLPDFCERCFWVKLHQKKLPFQMPMPGIFNSLDSYSKRVVHAYFDKYGHLPGYLDSVCTDVKRYVDGKQLHYSRYCFLDPATRILLTGSPDDIFAAGNGDHHMIDYKTAKFTQTQDELFPMYEVQLNGYALIAELAGLFRPISSLTLVYTEPVTDAAAVGDPRNWASAGFNLGFAAKLLPVALNLEMIPPLLQKVRQIGEMKKQPAGAMGCENCFLLGQLVRTAAAA
jgi:hypothetical protein